MSQPDSSPPASRDLRSNPAVPGAALAVVLAVVPLFAATLGVPAPAAAQSFGGPPKASVELIADRTSYAPGGLATIAARVIVEDGWHINSHEPTFPWLIPTTFGLEAPQDQEEAWGEPQVQYPPHQMKTFAFEDEPLAVYDGEVVIRVALEIPESAARGTVRLEGRLELQACDDKQCLPPTAVSDTIALEIGEQGELVAMAPFDGSGGSAGSAGSGTGTGAAAGQSLLLMLGLGVVGGLILNLMPCVLPVLSLKVFGLVKSAGQGRGAVVGGSLATALGILLSFWALGGAAVIARAAGAAVGWGVQFQNPVFVVFLLVVVVLFCLNLWGLFEIPLPQFVARAAGSAGPREGVAGHLASGLFATLMATPCSAPFLGTAIAFALAQPAAIIFAIFTAVGIGMALPYLVLAAAPRLAGLLPKPGAWMDVLRKVMGFLLAGAAVWLLYVLASQVSREARAWIELSMLGMALLVWLRQRALTSAVLQRAADVGVAAVAAGAILIGWQANAAQAVAPGDGAGDLIQWVEFDRDRAETLAREGTLVFVDVTADWCFTCKVNERLVLETEPVAAAFEEHAVVPMKADWTNRNDRIAAFLEDHGRFGIPFYLLYRPGREPHVFSELISKDQLIRLVEEASGAASPTATGG
ncbi:MAG: thioredoxin family protein [Acidobacteriota bacterium]|jgi:suppressor for copper-sensitivity B